MRPFVASLSVFLVAVSVSYQYGLRFFQQADTRCVLKLSSALLASAKTVTIVVGGNGTAQDPSLIFQPQEIKADVGDFVVFNCTSSIIPPSRVTPTNHVFAVTNGTHSVVESTFAQPCLSIHETNTTFNGFNSGLRDAVNGTAITTLSFEIKEEDRNRSIWYYDIWGCAEGGVGAININDSDWENLDAFVRNAKRLNGSGDTSSSSLTGRPTSARPVPTSTAAGNSAERVGENTVKAISIFAPFLLAMFAV